VGWIGLAVLSMPLIMNSQVPYKVEFEVPNGLLDVEGNDGTELPFSYLGPVRYQQVYDASQFSTVPAGGAFITRMFVRADCNSVGSQVSSNIQMRLSTTSRAPDQLSVAFDENAGPDETLVWNVPRYVPPAGSSTCPEGFSGPNEFLMDIPFFYDPARGNLLLDLKKESTERNPALWWPPTLDAQNVAGDSVSRAVAFSLTTNKAEILDTVGLVTCFEVFPTPTLKVTQETNNVILTWFWSFQTNTFKLQWTDRVGPEAVWADYAGEVVQSGFLYRAIQPVSSLSGSRFYRLFWDTPQPLGGPLITTPVQAKVAPAS
jgi:hypothetical protein